MLTRVTGDRTVLGVDVGGSHVKAKLSTSGEERRFDSGPELTAQQMVDGVRGADERLELRRESRSASRRPCGTDESSPEPVNLGPGWVGFDFEQAFGKPTKVINDAAMQALGSYEGGKMLFLGLGTGLGSALVVDGRRGAARARAPAVPQGDLRGLRRRARPRAARQEELARGGRRDRRPPERRWSPTTSSSAAATPRS